jgi:hypothetical protein
MWIFRYTYCVIQGHAFVDIVTDRQPYQYCLHCGKIEGREYHGSGLKGGWHSGRPHNF